MARRIKVKVARLAMTLVTAVFLSGMAFNAASQIDMHPSGYIKIRSFNNHGDTEHYGNLFLQGTAAVPNAGWLVANTIQLSANAHIDSSVWINNWLVANSFKLDNRAVIDSNVWIGGDLGVVGNVTATTWNGVNKCFIHPHPTDTTKLIRYTTIESGEALTVARGTAKTTGGQATIKLPDHFTMVTSPNMPLTVTLTPKGAPAVLYTKQESTKEIVVAMKNSDFAEFKDINFSYHVTGVRDGFEDVDVIINEEKLAEPLIVPGAEKNEVQKKIGAFIERTRARGETKGPNKPLGLEGRLELPLNAATAPAAPAINQDMAGISNEEMKNAQTPAPAPQSSQNVEAAVTAQAKTLIAEFTAGPNPADRRAGGVVNFYYQGKSIKNGQATIYDAAGNIIGKVKIRDNAQGGDQSKRQVGWWNLTDRMGRLVSEGTYLVKGTVTGADGKKGGVSVMVGVR